MIVFDGMIADLIFIKKYLLSTTYEGYGTKSFFGVHYTIILPNTKRCKTKHYTLLKLFLIILLILTPKTL